MSRQLDYRLRTSIDAPHSEALRRTRDALQAQGFGVLCEIDIREKLREKLGVDFKRYVILGACNPPFAYEALQAEPEIGLLLPCNVIVYEESESRCIVAAVDPDAMMSVVGDNPRLQGVAADARARLAKAIASL
jgi:uncharacterized protein (DUF302 family)